MDAKDELTCPVCTELCIRPRECLACGRLYCAACIAHLKSCPICRKEPFISRDNRLAARLVNKPQVKCGKCEAQICRSLVEQHKKTCAERVRKCSFIHCEFAANNRGDAVDHINRQHMDEIWANFDHLSQLKSSGICCIIVVNSKISCLINFKQDFKINSQSVWRSAKISHFAEFRSVDRSIEPRTLSDRTAVIISFPFYFSISFNLLLVLVQIILQLR